MISKLSLPLIAPADQGTDVGGASGTPTTAIPKLIGQVVPGHGEYRFVWSDTKPPYTVYYNNASVDRGSNNYYTVSSSSVHTKVVITDGYGQRYTYDVIGASLPSPPSLPVQPAAPAAPAGSQLSRPVKLFSISLPLYGWLGIGAGAFYLISR